MNDDGEFSDIWKTRLKDEIFPLRAKKNYLKRYSYNWQLITSERRLVLIKAFLSLRESTGFRDDDFRQYTILSYFTLF